MDIPVGFAEMAVEYRHSSDPQSWFTIVGVETDLATNSAQDHVDHFAGVWYGELVPRLATAVTLVDVQGTFGQDGGGGLVVNTMVGQLNGSRASATLPQNCAALIKKQTSLGGRAGRGRMFLPAVLPETDVNEVGVIQPAWLAELQDMATDLLDGLAAPDPVTGAMTPMVLLHGPAKSTGLTPAPTPVNSLIVDSVISTQRDRLR